MKIDNLALSNFRNYGKQEVTLGQGINFFVGNNGSGKTNMLEAIYVLALAKSYKTSETNLIKYEHDFARVTATVNNKTNKYQLKIIISEQGKKAMINNSEIRKLSDYIGAVNVLSFFPEDLMIIKGSPKDRRYYIDIIYGQIDKNYLNEFANYKSILKQRNELLKKMSESNASDTLLLDVLTEQLSASAEIMIAMRKSFVKQINSSLKSMYRFLTDRNYEFLFEYKPSIEKDVESTLKSKYKSDILLKTTTFGPHRDDYDFLLDKLQARDVASQGEQRLMGLALLLAIGDVVYKVKGERPVFLLDDVFSELDHARQNRLIKYLNELDAQTIITTTTISNIDPSILKESKIFKVQNNTVREEHKHE